MNIPGVKIATTPRARTFTKRSTKKKPRERDVSQAPISLTPCVNIPAPTPGMLRLRRNRQEFKLKKEGKALKNELSVGDLIPEPRPEPYALHTVKYNGEEILVPVDGINIETDKYIIIDSGTNDQGNSFGYHMCGRYTIVKDKYVAPVPNVAVGPTKYICMNDDGGCTIETIDIPDNRLSMKVRPVIIPPCATPRARPLAFTSDDNSRRPLTLNVLSQMANH